MIDFDLKYLNALSILQVKSLNRVMSNIKVLPQISFFLASLPFDVLHYNSLDGFHKCSLQLDIILYVTHSSKFYILFKGVLHLLPPK